MTKEKDEKINLEELSNDEEPQDEEILDEEEVLDEESGEELTEPPSEEEGDEKKEEPSSINIDDLSNRLSEMEKANKGLRKAVTSIRSEKQALAAKLEQLTEIHTAAKQQREEQAEEKPLPKIKV